MKNFFFFFFYNSSSESDNSSFNKDINYLMKTYFIFIIIFHPDNNIAELFLNFILGNCFHVENEKWKILKFLTDNLINYEEEDIKHIINYLYHNKVYLLGDNLKIIFNYFSKNKKENTPTIKIKFITDDLKILIENINFNSLKIPNNMIETELTFEEFKYIINNYL